MSSLALSGLCLVALALYAAFGEDTSNPCAGAADGKAIAIMCSGFTNCTKEKPEAVICEEGSVVEIDTLECIPIRTGKTICGTSGKCTGTGLRPSKDCKSFYFCQDGAFAANTHMYCANGLLFDGSVCNYHENVTCNAA